MLVAALTCLAFIVPPSTSFPLPVPPSNYQKNTQKDLISLDEYDSISSNEQKLNAPPFQCKAPPCTPSRILHRAKRTIDLFPFSLLKVADCSLIYLNWIHWEAILLGMYVVCTCFFFKSRAYSGEPAWSEIADISWCPLRGKQLCPIWVSWLKYETKLTDHIKTCKQIL